MSITELIEIMPPPSDPVDVYGNFEAVEQRLSRELPADYKRFVELYGSGRIADFFTVLNPFSKNPRLNLELSQIEAAHQFSTIEQSPQSKLYYKPESMLFIASTDNGDYFFWDTSNKCSEGSIIVLDTRSFDFERFRFDIIEFLVAFIKGELVSNILESNAAYSNEFTKIEA